MFSWLCAAAPPPSRLAIADRGLPEAQESGSDFITLRLNPITLILSFSRPREGARSRCVVSCAALLLVAATVAAAAPVRWIAVGGGADPRSTQVSLEQDVALAKETLGPGGKLFFAGGEDAYAVQVLNQTPHGDALLRELGDLFEPRDGRDAHYRRPAVHTDGPATDTELFDALSAALQDGAAPLLVYVATHGDVGESPSENSIHLWGDEAVTVGDLAEFLARHRSRRPLRFVVTSCYSGGFAELAFAGASPENGAAPGIRCGLFSTEWDRQASGCDPNPDRGTQQGYGIHFWHALRGEDRDGQPLPPSVLDLDGDGKISLLEAHTRARIASTSIDIPTTTSERWLREAVPAGGAIETIAAAAPMSFPEEDAVIATLGSQLSLPNEVTARRRFDHLSDELRQANDAEARAEDDEADAYADLRISLLGRWPVLDDPWHPDFASTIRDHRAAIDAALHQGTRPAVYHSALDRLSRAGDVAERVLLEYARVARLVRAYETRALANRLRAQGGPAWETYRRLLECERGTPR